MLLCKSEEIIFHKASSKLTSNLNLKSRFSISDLTSSAEMLDGMMSDGCSPDWEVIKGVLESAVYGARVEDQDIFKIRVYLEKYFNPGKKYFDNNYLDIFATKGINALRIIKNISKNNSDIRYSKIK